MDISKLSPPPSIATITVKGYKSLNQAQRLEIRPLTVLAGANSSGKSSVMQPLLLLKQTLEASYDPGALLLDGPYVNLNSVEQVLSKNAEGSSAQQFSIECELEAHKILTAPKAKKIGIVFEKSSEKGFTIKRMSYQEDKGESINLYPEMPHEEIINIIPSTLREMYDTVWFKTQPMLQKNHFHWIVKRYRCFLSFAMMSEKDYQTLSMSPPFFSYDLARHLQNTIYLSGLRGNPERTYTTSAFEDEFPGDFKHYVASILYHWQQTKHDNIVRICDALRELNLTNYIQAKPIDDARVELKVSRLMNEKPGREHDLVSIADVGFGVSQALPILVALVVAKPGQIVYLEQPEIHLHPNAQHKLANLLVDAVIRGVRVIVETHSSLLLTGIQTLIAAGKLSSDQIKLHWFTRVSGNTEITSADVDERGAFGQWPQDFDDVTLDVENAYLTAVEQKGLYAQ